MAATGATLQPPSTRVPARSARLPYGWPVYVLFLGFPLWWVLGLASFIWPVMAVPITFSLLSRDKVRLPKGFGFYLLFFLWMLATALQISGPDRMIGFAYRAILYYSAGAFGLYVYNAPKRALPAETLVRVMAFFWVVVVAGGLFGIVAPTFQMKTVAETLMPQRLLGNDYVYSLVHPLAAQVQTFLGYPVPRPTAPFVFTNDWGGNFALLVPFVLASWTLLVERVRRDWLDRLVRLLVPLSLFPVVFSLNRTLWASLALIAVYGSTRFGARGRSVAVLQSAAVLVVLVAFLFSFGPTKQLISDRVATPHSNQGRESLYHQSIDLAAQQPLLGYGGPQQSTADTKSSTYKHPDVGTQGQLWTVLVANGLPATFFFFGYLAFFVFQTRRAKSPLALWCHIVVLVALFQSPFYGLLAAQLHLVFIAVGLASREVTEPDPAPVPAAPRARPLVHAVRSDGWPPPPD